MLQKLIYILIVQRRSGFMGPSYTITQSSKERNSNLLPRERSVTATKYVGKEVVSNECAIDPRLRNEERMPEPTTTNPMASGNINKASTVIKRGRGRPPK